MSVTIPLFYWSERKFIFRDKENYGDLLSKYLVEKISDKKVKFVHPKKQPWYKLDKKHFLAIGSILHHATSNSIVWGSGIIDSQHAVADADFRAVRGPRTREYLLKQGYTCPAVYGDPAILLPDHFFPVVEKKFALGVIPHYHDYEKAKDFYSNDKSVKVIDLMTLDVEKVTVEILSCERCISSSLHGLIVSHAYGIPCVWVEFSHKLFGDGIKFQDYFESVGLDVYKPTFIDHEFFKSAKDLFEDKAVKPDTDKLNNLKRDLMDVCPFN